MAMDQETADSEFSLFDEEERVLKRAASMIVKLEEVVQGLHGLANAYKQGYREQRRMLRISDRQQLDLHQANQTLASQSQELKQLNAALEAENQLRETLAKELRLIATTDVLTGLHTRRHILELGKHEESRWRRHQGHLSLALIDLDHFKKVNDAHGHAGGDEVLKQFAAICRRSFRQADCIGRFGGEEFLVILPETGLDEACAIAERLRCQTQEETIALPDGETRITISIGTTELRIGDSSLEQAISRADMALYRAKNAGRNRTERMDVEGEGVE